MNDKPNKAKNFKWAQVLLYGAPLYSYTIIQAQCPRDWGVFEKVYLPLYSYFLF
jgi:hypothetical protein